MHPSVSPRRVRAPAVYVHVPAPSPPETLSSPKTQRVFFSPRSCRFPLSETMVPSNTSPMMHHSSPSVGTRADGVQKRFLTEPVAGFRTNLFSSERSRVPRDVDTATLSHGTPKTSSLGRRPFILDSELQRRDSRRDIPAGLHLPKISSSSPRSGVDTSLNQSPRYSSISQTEEIAPSLSTQTRSPRREASRSTMSRIEMQNIAQRELDLRYARKVIGDSRRFLSLSSTRSPSTSQSRNVSRSSSRPPSTNLGTCSFIKNVNDVVAHFAPPVVLDIPSIPPPKSILSISSIPTAEPSLKPMNSFSARSLDKVRDRIFHRETSKKIPGLDGSLSEIAPSVRVIVPQKEQKQPPLEERLKEVRLSPRIIQALTGVTTDPLKNSHSDVGSPQVNDSVHALEPFEKGNDQSVVSSDSSTWCTPTHVDLAHSARFPPLDPIPRLDFGSLVQNRCPSSLSTFELDASPESDRANAPILMESPSRKKDSESSRFSPLLQSSVRGGDRKDVRNLAEYYRREEKAAEERYRQSLSHLRRSTVYTSNHSGFEGDPIQSSSSQSSRFAQESRIFSDEEVAILSNPRYLDDSFGLEGWSS